MKQRVHSVRSYPGDLELIQAIVPVLVLRKYKKDLMTHETKMLGHYLPLYVHVICNAQRQITLQLVVGIC